MKTRHTLRTRLSALFLILILLVPCMASATRIYTQGDYDDDPRWSLYGYPDRTLATSGCILFTYAHAIQELTGTNRGDELLTELLKVCSDPNGYYGHAKCTHSSSHADKHALAYRLHVAKKYGILSSSSFAKANEQAIADVLDDGGVIVLSGLSPTGRHVALMVEYDVDYRGKGYVRIIDSNPASFHQSAKHTKYYYKDGNRFRAYSSYSNEGTSYWLKMSDVLGGGFVPGRILTIKNALNLNKTAKTMKPGTTFAITSGNADAVLTFFSSDETVATVDETGIVTARSAGKCKIYVYNENNRKTTVDITVKSVAIKLDKSSITLKKGETAVITPSQKGTVGAVYSFKSSSRKIASVAADGTVTARKKGSCIITVTSSFGEKATVSVKVR